jgi:hypothetical protein
MICAVLKKLTMYAAVAATFAWVAVAHGATALPQVDMHVAFIPDKPGTETTVAVGFHIRTPHGELPPPITKLDISLPAGMGLGTTDLGEATCSTAVLERLGPEGCPPNSFMGTGHGLIDAQIGPQILEEPVKLTILMTEAQRERTTLLMQGAGYNPVEAEAIFTSQLVGEHGYGATLVTEIPLVRPLPEADTYMALTSMFTTMGPQNLTYYKGKKGKRIPYKPRGIAIPPLCPRGGYRFQGAFTFLGFAPQVVTSAVPCVDGRDGRRIHGRKR